MPAKTYFLFAMLLFTLPFFAQKNKYELPLDAASALQIVKEKKMLYRNSWLTEEEIARTPSYQPQLEFIAEKNQWKITSKKYKPAHKKKYREVNGITLELSMIVIVDAETGKILSKKKTKREIPNYEF